MKIGIDIGGTKIGIGFFKNNDLSVPYKTIELRTETYDQSITKILESITEELGTKSNVVSIGIGIAGIIDRTRNVLHKAPNLKTWANRPMVHTLATKFRCKVVLENDSVVAAVGEFIAQKKYKTLFNVIWGTGVGGTFIRKEGSTLIIYPTEIGHHILDPEGPLCACGQKGCLEAFIGGASIYRLYGIDPAKLTNEAIWKRISTYACIGIHNISIFFRPELITFNGGIIVGKPELLRTIKQNFTKISMMTKMPDLELTQLNSKAALIGAVNLTKLKYRIA